MIKFELYDNTGQLKHSIQLAKEALEDWTPFFEELHPIWLASREEQFRTAGRAYGTPWPMYSRATGEHQYAAVKASIFGRKLSQADLLRWLNSDGRERLYPSIVNASHPDHIYRVTPTSGEYGTSVPYAENHEYGTGKMPEWAGGRPVPKRPLMSLGPASSVFHQEMAELLSKWAGEGLNQGVLGYSTSEVLEMKRRLS